MGAFFTSRIVSDILIGAAQGVLVGLIALSLVLIWQSTHVLNFAQGAMAMFAAFCGMTMLEHGLNYWVCVLISLVAAMLLGGVTERVLVRPLYGKAEINSIVVMVGFLGILESGASSIWSGMARQLTSPLSQTYFTLGSKTLYLSPFSLFQIGSALTLMLGVAALFRFTKIGLQLRASALAPEVSRLLGVRVSRMLTLGWIISSAVGAFAAIIIATSGSGLFPSNMDGFFVFGFIAAAIGGLESPGGAILAGLLIGIIQTFVADYLSPSWVAFTPVLILVLSQLVRPAGIFTKNTTRRL